MAIMTEAELRELIRQPQPGLTLTVPPGTRFSPAAQDFIKHWQLDVVFAEGAQIPLTGSAAAGNGNRPAWDRAAEFPVKVEGTPPICTTCGMSVTIKPEHLTQLDAEHFAPKNVPRIRFRGKVDTLHGLMLLVGAQARAANRLDLAGHLDSLAAYCREIMSAEYNERPAAPLTLAGLDEETLHKATHHPDETLGLPHITPGSGDPALLLWLNYLRCLARETELTALDAFAAGPEYRMTNPSLVKAVNRLSSAIYYLELLFKAGK